MEARLGQHLTLLGMAALLFCLVTSAMGTLSAGELALFLVSGLIFFAAGSAMKRAEKQEESSRHSRASRAVALSRSGRLNYLMHQEVALLALATVILLLVFLPWVSLSGLFVGSQGADVFSVLIAP